MEAFTVLIVITLILVSLCCLVYLEKNFVRWVKDLIRFVEAELEK